MLNIIFKIERWKFNKEYGIYVSSEGHFKDRYKRLIPVKINHGGYCMIKTEQGDKLAHRLVMLTWRPVPNAEELTVDHLDHNKRYNSIQNLEWVSKQENLERAKRDFIDRGTEADDEEPRYYIQWGDSYDFNGAVQKVSSILNKNIKEVKPHLKSILEGKVKSYKGIKLIEKE